MGLERRGSLFQNTSHRNCLSSPKARYVNDKLQVTDPLLRIGAKLLLLKLKEKTKQKPSRSR